MNDFDTELDARISMALHAAANQITAESLSATPVPTSARVMSLRPSRARWMAPMLAAAAVAAVIVGTVAIVTSSPSASGPHHIQPGGSTSPAHTTPSPISTTVTASRVATGPTGQKVCAFADVLGCNSTFYYVPIWPFLNYNQVVQWEKVGIAGGAQPWHNDADLTALEFTQNFLHYSDITTVTSSVIKGSEAHVGVGYTNPNNAKHTAAILHLVRYGTSDGPWEVVGSDDTDFTLEKPAYGAQIAQVMTVGGHVTGVDENIVVSVRMQDGTIVSLGNPSTPAGGQNSPWTVQVTTQVPLNGRRSFPLVVIAFTGGHLEQHERFAIQGVYS